MATEFWVAEAEVHNIAQSLIDEHHPNLQGVPITYLMRCPTAKSNGAEVWGSTSKANAKQRALVKEDIQFIIELASEVWEHLGIFQKRALIDHELCHCGVEVDDEGEAKYSIRGHDIQEFSNIVKRHGKWNDTITYFADQLSLFEPSPLKAVGE